MGGTGSCREVDWWETTSFNIALIGGALLIVVTGAVVALRRARGTVRWLTMATSGLITVFIVSLGFGLALTQDTVD